MRHGDILLARLRAGHTPLPKTYTNQLDTTFDSKCPRLGEAPQTVEHWLQQYYVLALPEETGYVCALGTGVYFCLKSVYSRY